MLRNSLSRLIKYVFFILDVCSTGLYSEHRCIAPWTQGTSTAARDYPTVSKRTFETWFCQVDGGSELRGGKSSLSATPRQMSEDVAPLLDLLCDMVTWVPVGRPRFRITEAHTVLLAPPWLSGLMPSRKHLSICLIRQWLITDILPVLIFHALLPLPEAPGTVNLRLGSLHRSAMENPGSELLIICSDRSDNH